jgi:hypothetical protein
MVIACGYVVLSSTGAPQNGEEIVPFTAQEWLWSVRDGYLSTMIVHSIRNHGV